MTIIDDVQARLDSYKTGKQRRRRLQELKRAADQHSGYIPLGFAIEAAVLMLWRSAKITVTAKEMSDDMQARAMSGEFRTHVEVDGEHIPISPEAFRKPH